MMGRLAAFFGGVMAVAGVMAEEWPAPRAAHFDGAGRLRVLAESGDALTLLSEIRAAGRGWATLAGVSPWTATGVTYAVEADGTEVWRGHWTLEPTGDFAYEQRVTHKPGGAAISLAVRAVRETALDGLYYFIQFPVRTHAGEPAELWRGTAMVARAVMPVDVLDEERARFLTSDGADRAVVRAGSAAVQVRLDRPRQMTLQDDRAWGDSVYSLFWPISRGPRMQAGDTVRIEFELSRTGQPDREPVEIAVQGEAAGGLFEGFGGNFVYGLDTPVATALVERLAPVRARIEMALHDWEPENDNALEFETDWAKFEARDAPGTDMRTRFELAALLAKRGVPIAISVWDLPEWMYAGPPRGRWASRRQVAPGLWPEVLESAGAYLLHLKRRYGVEPDLFSFNEPDVGIRVWLTAEEHRDAIRRFGRHFAALGLKTRMTLADVASPRGTASYGVYALSDPTTLPLIGAVSFHTWGGASPAEYEAWPALARRAGVPLIAMETGYDPLVWRTPHELEFTWHAIKEVKHILEVLAHARPQSALMWEYSDDYPLLRVRRGEDGREWLEETVRYRFLEQLVRLTPKPATPLTLATGNRVDMAAAGYAGLAGDGAPVRVLHVANRGAARPLVVTGLPAGWRYEAFMVGAAGGARRQAVPEADGRATLDMPAWSLTSLVGRPPP